MNQATDNKLFWENWPIMGTIESDHRIGCTIQRIHADNRIGPEVVSESCPVERLFRQDKDFPSSAFRQAMRLN